MTRSDRIVAGCVVFAGITLTVIGVRFWLWPEAAAKFFGVGARPVGTELYSVVALRDVWLGAMALGLLVMRDWKALALWFGLGAVVCFADAVLVVGATGRAQSVTFHVVSGVACVVLAAMCWARR